MFTITCSRCLTTHDAHTPRITDTCLARIVVHMHLVHHTQCDTSAGAILAHVNVSESKPHLTLCQ